MDSLDFFLKKFSYRFDKGFPELHEEKDILLLESILEKLDIKINLQELIKLSYDILTDEAKTIAQELITLLGISQDQIKPASKNKIVIYDDARSALISKIEDAGTYGKKRDSRNGDFKIGNTIIILKPASAQTGGGHGKENEELFRNTLTELINQAGKSASIKITDGSSNVTVHEITSVVDNSKTKTGEYYKPDADLMSGKNTILGVSIKKDGGSRWESSKTRLEDIYNNFIKKAKTGQIPNLKLVQRPDAREGRFFMQTEDGRNYGKIVIDEFPDTFDNEFIFGKKEQFPVIVAERTFTPGDFTLNGNLITVKTTKIYKTLEDVEKAGKSPVIVFSHHIRKPNGIEIRVFPESETPKEGGRAVTMKIHYDELI